MRINSVQIKNYRSIEDLTIEFARLSDQSATFGLIGVNEAGKSSILKALALKDELIVVSQKDFRAKNQPIEVIYNMTPDLEDSSEYHPKSEDDKNEFILIKKDEAVSNIKLTLRILSGSLTSREYEVQLFDSKNLALPTEFSQRLKPIIITQVPKAIFWTANQKYLITEPIELSRFAASPNEVSVPLKNCFLLAGIENIAERVGSLTESTDIEELQTVLGEKVTQHIQTVWPNHPIKITFLISNGILNFHVKDKESTAKAKTADQRSDGFRQFVSFLLTISAQSRNEELSNSILLLDEPETHLHPQAQEYLLSELIKITKGDKNNLCLFATHSLFMIDKVQLGRNCKVKKVTDKTLIEFFQNKSISYSMVAYEVFDIATTDLHNELYGILQEQSSCASEKDFDEYLQTKGLKRDVPYTKLKPANKQETYSVTLPVKIRNIIHHPENPHNAYTESELRKSIELLNSIR